MNVADILSGRTRLEWSIVTVFVTFWLQASEYAIPLFAPFVDALWLVSVLVMAYLTGKALKGLRADHTIRRRTVRIPMIAWYVSMFAFGSTSLLLMFRPLGYTADDIMMTAVQLLSPVVLVAIAMRATYLVNTPINTA